MIARTGTSRRGGAVLETAIVLPILLLMSFGLVEFADFFYLRHILQGAAREGARAAILAGVADPNAAVTQALTAAGLDTANYTITTTPSDLSSASPGDEIQVIVEGTWSVIGLRPMRLINGDTKVRGSAIMMKEGNLTP